MSYQYAMPTIYTCPTALKSYNGSMQLLFYYALYRQLAASAAAVIDKHYCGYSKFGEV